MLRQLSLFLQRPQTRSPDHALLNDILHLRHWRFFVALARSNTGFECSDIQEAYRAYDQLEVPRTEDRGKLRLNRCRQSKTPTAAPDGGLWGGGLEGRAKLTKCELLDDQNALVTDGDITGPPVLNVAFTPISGPADDVTDLALPAGHHRRDHR